MFRKFIVLLLMLSLSACGMMQGGGAAQPTALPTIAQAGASTPDPKATPVAALGGKQSGDLLVWIYSSPNPPIRGSNTFEAVLTDASGQPVPDAKLSFDIDMTNMSHGKNVIVAVPAEQGHYIGKVNFMMPGPWRVIVSIDRAGQTSTVRFDFNVNSR